MGKAHFQEPCFSFMVVILLDTSTGLEVKHRKTGAAARGESAGTLWYPFYSPKQPSWILLFLAFSLGFATGAVTVVFFVFR